MTLNEIPQRPLRLWPGVLAAVLLILLRYVVPTVVPEGFVFGLIGGVVCVLAIVVWWLFFSRAPWFERVGAIVLIVVAMYAAARVIHVSLASGADGKLFPFLAVPVVSLAMVAGAAASRRFSAGARRALLVVAILLACGAWTLLRTGGMTGDLNFELHWRWTPTPEERLLAQARIEPAALPPAPAEARKKPPVAKADEKPTALRATPPTAPSRAALKPAAPAAVGIEAEWPGFRGPHRDGIVPGGRIATDWSASPPVELWRRRVGPGWSSFAVHRDAFFTQEQRGDEEVVACYNLTTGKPVWSHRDAARFWELAGGAGPRGTPAVSNGRVYTMGATGIVNALDARDGSVVWTRNAATDTGATLPRWGFAGSPLVVEDQVIIAASGRLVAYDSATGKPAWTAQTGGGGYSSPQLMTIGGVAQVLLASAAGISSFAPADGKQFWAAPLTGSRIVQPALTADGDVLMTVGDEGGLGQSGLRRIAVAPGSGGWTVQERWTSRGLKPKFNDLVVHKGHAYGFDGSILSCIDLADGTRKWKGGRYGTGQLVLLPDQDLLMVLSEEGELALVKATPDQFKELARFPVLEGKTWNHPVLVGNVLLVRNGQEMAAFRLQ